jgi:GTP-binding protein
VIGGVAVTALLGRPNVGKSALFNRIVGTQRAIVDDVPGVTRDRLVAAAEHGGRRFLCIDTGGFHADVSQRDAALATRVRETALAAAEDADVLVCVVDGQAGLLPDDQALVRLLERTGRPLVLAVNKIDVAQQEDRVLEFHRTGASRLVATSAAHRRGIDALLGAVTALLPPAPAEPADAEGAGRLALVGRPNVGKSSLLNRLCGTERAIVSPEPGTTRDTIDTLLEREGRRYLLLDTAGIRRRGRVTDPIERHGAVRALAALERTDVALVVLDASAGMTDQDARLAGRALEAGRAVVLVANKWDLVASELRTAAAFREAMRGAHPGLAELPLAPVSALTGDGIDRLWAIVRRVERGYDRSIPTATLNRSLRAAVEAHQPPADHGRAVRFLYATQTGRRPPEITIFSSNPAAVGGAYRRYLSNRFSDAFGLEGIPLRLVFRRRHGEPGVNESRRPRSAGRGRRTGRPTRGGARPRRR